jgi:thiamine biosynthesis protein ThiS
MAPDRVREVLAVRARGVAVLSAINDAADPEAVAREFRQALEESMSEVRQQIDVSVNGKQASVPAGNTILDFLTERGHHDRLVVVELNGQIIARSAFSTTAISAGDRIEIVHFVGGG